MKSILVSSILAVAAVNLTGSPLTGLGILASTYPVAKREWEWDQQQILGTRQPQIQAQAQQTQVEVNPTIINNPQFNPSIQINAPNQPLVQPAPERKETKRVPKDRVAPWDQGTQPQEEDVARLIAEQNHSQIVALTDSGKTVTISAAIRKRWELENGNCEFWIADPKGSSFCGLNRSDRYLRIRQDASSVSKLPSFLRTVFNELNRRIDQRERTGKPTTAPKITVILDEFPSVLKMLKNALGSKAVDEVINLVESLLFMGREDRISLWIVTQSHYVSQCKLDGSVRDQMACFALGRLDRLETLARLAADSNMIPDRQTRDRLATQVREAQGSEVPLCLTTVGGEPRVLQVPDLRAYIDWQCPQVRELDPVAVPVESGLTPEQKGAVLANFREGCRSEFTLVSAAFPEADPTHANYASQRKQVMAVLENAGLLEEWTGRRSQRYPRS